MAADFRALAADPMRRDLIWRYGIASESSIRSTARPRSATGCAPILRRQRLAA
jgi:hypothetical protein